MPKEVRATKRTIFGEQEDGTWILGPEKPLEQVEIQICEQCDYEFENGDRCPDCGSWDVWSA